MWTTRPGVPIGRRSPRKRGPYSTPINNPAELSGVLGAGHSSAILATAIRKVESWPQLSASEVGPALKSFVSRIAILAGQVEIGIRPDRLEAWIMDAPTDPARQDRPEIRIVEPVRLQQRGQEMRLVFGNAHDVPDTNSSLVQLLTRAHSLMRRLTAEGATVDELARAERLAPSQLSRLIRLTFLAPDIVAAILSGRHHPDLTPTRLLAETRFPLDWVEQRRILAPIVQLAAAAGG